MEELPITPRGIKFQPDFISPAHEAALLHIFQHELSWPISRKPGSRLSLHYGYTFDYKTFGVDPNIPYNPFPEWLVPLIPRTVQGGRNPDQVCLQYYPPGAGIPPHVDTHSAYDELYALSLGSAVTMQFRHTRARVRVRVSENSNSHENDGAGKKSIGAAEEEEGGGGGGERETVDVDLPPRSMMEMSGASRLHWEHGIKKRKKDVLADGSVRARGERWSITYRWLREGGQCECGDARLCDTAQRRLGVEREFRWKQKQQQPKGGSVEEEEKEKEKEKGEKRPGRDKHGVTGMEDNRVVDQGHRHHQDSNIIASPP
ncbi:hypothetical protein F5Y08DRAFT_351738 [Xylaria arbuscula]|nr:hypothetical protein F5Y08DRAFT_351738 [Xylaria arbuscula]